MADLKALFVTTSTTEPIENVDAWVSAMGPAEHVTFDINGPQNDAEILARAKACEPDVIFYTGGTEGTGLPGEDTLRGLREIAPSVIMQGDFGDPPWWPMMNHYRTLECFDLQVAMDGVRDCPADLVTLTPFDLTKYDGWRRQRDIRCGFGGNAMTRDYYDGLKQAGKATDPRSEFLYGLGNKVVIRPREITGNYAGYVEFMQRCEIILNTCVAGSGTVNHVKGRVLEATFAGAALLEHEVSPAHDWFPADTFFKYRGTDQARAIIEGADDTEIAARALSATLYAVEHYNARRIYRGILDRVGL